MSAKTLDISVNCDSYAEKRFLFVHLCAGSRLFRWRSLERWGLDSVQDRICRERCATSCGSFTTNGEAFDLHTGYYDRKEDERNHEEDRYTGWWYVSAD